MNPLHVLVILLAVTFILFVLGIVSMIIFYQWIVKKYNAWKSKQYNGEQHPPTR